ncbi:hypothetical protein Tco_0892116 [Tanacetum coccineum]|uniref:Uncharacterized protein n=1 Tax=Tanacetum coccineum TaxID=301880 RepID=A0ABQ5CB01_9ASTR
MALAPSMTPSPNKLTWFSGVLLWKGPVNKSLVITYGVLLWKGPVNKFYFIYYSEDVLTICEGLRSIDPDLFSLKRPLDIAQELIQDVKKNRKSAKMLDNLHIHDDGYITFNLSSEWMVKRIKKMLGEDGGEIKSKRSITPLFSMKEEAIQRIPGRSLLNNVFEDLGTLWQAINVQRGELIVFVTLVRQREHVEQCIDAAKIVKWLPGEWSPTVLCIGYHTSSTERENLESVWNEFESHPKSRIPCEDAGYSVEDSFDCVVK